MQVLDINELLAQLPPFSYDVGEVFASTLMRFNSKIIVLDDDPTGVQTVHDVPVYTSWEQVDIDNGFSEDGMFFILTNSRGLTAAKAEQLNRDIAERIFKTYTASGKDFVIISRSDSTLRGYYPLETATLRRILEGCGDTNYDGEIICPFFIEGGRYTYDDVHYVRYDDRLIPAAQTEFAKDRSFGYISSNLREFVEEKTKGEYLSGDTGSISIKMIRQGGPVAVQDELMKVRDFGKVIVNAVSFDDIRGFIAGYIMAHEAGKRFIFRSAAAIPKILGGIEDQPLLSRAQLVTSECTGGLIVIGSHVEKTTQQLQALLKVSGIVPLEFNQHLVLEPVLFEAEQQRVSKETNRLLNEGKDVVIYTRRERLDMGTDNVEDELQLTNRISDAVTYFVKSLTVKPKYIIAKGGITSSEIGTIGLGVKRAIVAGQVLPGIPVWRLGEESRFPGMAYIIFPGNVGEVDALANIVESLRV